MEKMKMLSEALEDSIGIAADIMEAADKVKDAMSRLLRVISTVREVFGIPDVGLEPEPEPVKKAAKKKAPEALPEPEPEEKAYTKEEVRMALAALAQKDRESVKSMLQKYGAENLASLDPAHYAAIMADAEAANNG